MQSYFEPTPIPYLCVNDSGETLPAHGIAVITGSRKVRGVRCLSVEKPSTTFHRHHVVIGPQDIPDGDDITGTCYRYGAQVIQLYEFESSYPLVGEGFGPQPDSFSLKRGFPNSTIVDGYINDDGNDGTTLLIGSFQPITQLLCKTNSAISMGTSTSNAYDIYRHNSAGADVYAGFTTAPTMTNHVDFTDDIWIYSVWFNNSWIATPLECP